ncbi:MAG: flagellin FliC [Planctomycetes bacterium]|nr:flagellin FliC [Planctomycetota bacterium]
MGLRVNTNISSIVAQRNLSEVTLRLQKNFSHLASGLRISVAADDAAGLAISERLRAKIRSVGQAVRNANDGISLVQTAEGALSEDSNILSRMKELAVQARNGTSSSSDRVTLDDEFQSLIAALGRNASATTYGGVNLLDGSASTITFQVGDGTTAGVDSYTTSLADVTTTGALAVSTLTINSSCTTTIDNVITSVDSAIDVVNSARGRFGAAQNRLTSTISSLQISSENLTAAESRIRDVDVALESGDLTRNSILQQAATAILGQANLQPQAAIQLLRG